MTDRAEGGRDVRQTLLATLEAKARLLAGLARALSDQRAAVARGDVIALDEATGDVARMVFSLDEAIRGQRGLEADRLAEVADDPRVRELHDTLERTVRMLTRDVALTQHMLRKAVQADERELLALLAAQQDESPTYGDRSSATSSRPASGSLLNTRA